MSTSDKDARLSTWDKDAMLVGYSETVNVYVQTASTLWATFNALLFANSVLIGVIGISFGLLSESCAGRIVSAILCGLGLAVLCPTWLALTERHFKWQKYFGLSARELEETALPRSIKTWERVGDLRRGKLVKLRVNEEKSKDNSVQMRGLQRIQGVWATRSVIGVVALVYVLFLIRTFL